MSKRKQADGDDDDDDDDSSDEQTPTLVDVNFDYYNVDAANDYHAIHRLLVQLFGSDAERIQTGSLADVVVTVAQESGVGSTVKTEEEEGSDPYAILTVLSCRDHSGLRGLIDYVLSKTSADPEFYNTLSSLLQEDGQGHVGLVVSERLVNMPVQVMPPMYRMLSEEMEEEGQGYRFTHYLFISRVYHLSAEEEEAMLASQRNSKRYRSMPRLKASKDGVYGFHPEDEEIIQYATHVVTYPFTNCDDLAGRAMLVPAEGLQGLVKKMEEAY